MILEAIQQECFVGERTGKVNVTLLIAYLEATKHQVSVSAFTKPNLQGMIEAHDWDASFKKRIYALRKRREWKPLVVVLNEEADGGVFVIDGWHRLYILNQEAKFSPRGDVPFLNWTVTMDTLRLFPVSDNSIIREKA